MSDVADRVRDIAKNFAANHPQIAAQIVNVTDVAADDNNVAAHIAELTDIHSAQNMIAL